jgi:hypothetical protein
MRRSVILFALALAAACGPPHEGESPVSGGSPSSSGVVASAVHGIVLGAGGRPVDGAVVVAVSTDEPAQAVPELVVVTGPDGRFEWPLRPGRYRLGAESRAVDVVVVATGPGPQVEIRLVG